MRLNAPSMRCMARMKPVADHLEFPPRFSPAALASQVIPVKPMPAARPAGAGSKGSKQARGSLPAHMAIYARAAGASAAAHSTPTKPPPPPPQTPGPARTLDAAAPMAKLLSPGQKKQECVRGVSAEQPSASAKATATVVLRGADRGNGGTSGSSGSAPADPASSSSSSVMRQAADGSDPGAACSRQGSGGLSATLQLSSPSASQVPENRAAEAAAAPAADPGSPTSRAAAAGDAMDVCAGYTPGGTGPPAPPGLASPGVEGRLSLAEFLLAGPPRQGHEQSGATEQGDVGLALFAASPRLQPEMSPVALPPLPMLPDMPVGEGSDTAATAAAVGSPVSASLALLGSQSSFTFADVTPSGSPRAGAAAAGGLVEPSQLLPCDGWGLPTATAVMAAGAPSASADSGSEGAGPDLLLCSDSDDESPADGVMTAGGVRRLRLAQHPLPRAGSCSPAASLTAGAACQEAAPTPAAVSVQPAASLADRPAASAAFAAISGDASPMQRRPPGRGPMPGLPAFLDLLRSGSSAFAADGRVLRLRQFLRPDVEPEVIDAVLEALAANGRVEVLYMQAFEAGVGDAQLDRLAALLVAAPQLWAVHLGENKRVSRRAWERFAAALPATSVAHLYVSERHLAGSDLKERMQASAAANAARAPRRDPEVLAHVAGMWTAPPPPPPPPVPPHGRRAGALPAPSADSGGCSTDEEEEGSAASGGAGADEDPELLPFGSLPQLRVGLGLAPSGLGPPISSPISRRQPGSLAAAGRARGRLPLPNARPVAGASRASSLLPLPPPPKPLGPDGQPIDTSASMRLRSGSSVATAPPALPHRSAPGTRAAPPPPPAPKPAPLPTVTSGRTPRRAAARRAAQALGAGSVTSGSAAARAAPEAPAPPQAKRLRAAGGRAAVAAPPPPAPANVDDDDDFLPPARSATSSARRSHSTASAATRAVRAPVAAVAATSSSGQGEQSGQGSASSACRPELKGKPSFAELLEGGFMQPGPYRFAVGNADVVVMLEADGAIVYGGHRYRAISKFALVVLRERNPARQSCDGWKEVAWNGEKLDALRARFQQHQRRVAAKAGSGQ